MQAVIGFLVVKYKFKEVSTISLKSKDASNINMDTISAETKMSIKSATSDVNAEMLIAIPDRIPATYLVPPPFPAPLSIYIKRKPSLVQSASRRYYQDPRPFTYTRNMMNRIPVNSIQDILNQMERESKDFERVSIKKPKRINFYGRYRHRPNRPQVIPIKYGEEPTYHGQTIRDSNPSVAKDVNHLITPNAVPQHETPQLFYPNPTLSQSSIQSQGLYDQIIATNKHRLETAKDAKPFSLMLDIYPMTDDNKTSTVTVLPPLTPPQLPPLQIDHSYYNSIRFPQIYSTPSTEHYQPPLITVTPKDEPEKMVVHLNLYPTKKKNHEREKPTHIRFFNEQEQDNVFMPIINPQVYYRSRSDKKNPSYRDSSSKEEVINIPRGILMPTTSKGPSPGIPRISVLKSTNLGPPINIIDYRTTIAPQTINKILYGEDPPLYTYLGQFDSNEIGRRMDTQLEPTTLKPAMDALPKPLNSQRNSHQPDNPMVVENFSLYKRSAIVEKPSIKAIS